MLYPYIRYTKSINPIVIELPHPTNPEADVAIIGSRKLISQHLRKILEYCNEFFNRYSEELDDKSRLGIMIDLHDILIKHLQPKLEEAYTKFWEASEQVI
ncbi:hypothetical protein GZ77_07680 [Endozoicomonas montiporae]|uniref:Uncharacterized protein n=2 Tax=Endozoicomonas montiporae TaxID=1027273 RepID=A0A081N759_9GAMM|nr:hypothetical protein [Endozoicomonas montiporae]AMO55900.1 hypothetical protein EZMO1_1751 [Endozoicomonas montiporae CL-33]KEQ14282.1 hypothetical protein GZ77_07680 [Endozoicomonas montiporae]